MSKAGKAVFFILSIVAVILALKLIGSVKESQKEIENLTVSLENEKAELSKVREEKAVLMKELDKEIASHETNSATAKWAIKLQASGRYGRYLKERRGKVVINTAAIRKAERMDGKWVVTTNDDTLSFEDAATGYKNLMVIERCFRSLKRTRIQMSPMHHWLPKRIKAHVKICVLALLIERVAELATGLPWPRIRHELERLQVTEYRTKTHQFFERNELPTGASEILKKLTIPPPKTVIDISNKP